MAPPSAWRAALLVTALVLCIASAAAEDATQPHAAGAPQGETAAPGTETVASADSSAQASKADSSAADASPADPANASDALHVQVPEQPSSQPNVPDVEAEIDDIEDVIRHLQEKVAGLRQSLRSGGGARPASKPQSPKRASTPARAPRADPLVERIHGEEGGRWGEREAPYVSDGDVDEWLEVTGRVQLGAEATALAFLPAASPFQAMAPQGGRKPPPRIDPRSPRRFVVADVTGRLRAFDHAGTELASVPANRTARVAAMTASPYVDDMLLVTGDVEGFICVYAVSLEKPKRTFGARSSPTPGPPPPAMTVALESEWQLPAGADGAPPPAATALVTYRRIRATFVVVGDGGGSIATFSRNGTYQGFVKARGAVLALQLSGNTLAYSTAAGEFGVVDIRTGAATPLLCAGLRQTVLTSLTFDPYAPSALYAGTSCGQLLSLRLYQDGKVQKCKLATAATGAHAAGPVHVGVVRGYVLSAASADGLAVHNVTWLGRQAPGLVFRHPRRPAEARAGGRDPLAERVRPVTSPSLMVVNNARREGPQAAAVAGPEGEVVVYAVHLPYEGEKVPWQVWKSPLAIGAVVFIIFWQFKKFRGGGKAGAAAADRLAAGLGGRGPGGRTPREREREAMENIHAMLSGAGGGLGGGAGGGRAGDRRVRFSEGAGGSDLDSIRAKVDALSARLSSAGGGDGSGAGVGRDFGDVD